MTAGAEFSRPVKVSRPDDGPRAYEIAADDGERAALCRRFGLKGLDKLAASLRLDQADKPADIRLSGTFVAEFVQSCVVTGQPLARRLEGAIDRTFATNLPAGETDFDPEDIDPPDILIDSVIDIGEIVAEHMGLEIDPYPRAPEAAFEDLSVGAEDGEDAAAELKGTNPFSVLNKLKMREE